MRTSTRRSRRRWRWRRRRTRMRRACASRRAVSSENITLDQTGRAHRHARSLGLAAVRVVSRAVGARLRPVAHGLERADAVLDRSTAAQSVRVIEQHVYVFQPEEARRAQDRPGDGAHRRHRAQDARDHRARRRAAQERDVVGGQAGSRSRASRCRRRPSRCAATRTSSSTRASTRPRSTSAQQVTASWRLYTQSDILKYRPLAEPKYEDFWSEDLFVPTSHLAWDRAGRQRARVRGGAAAQEGALPAQGGQARPSRRSRPRRRRCRRAFMRRRLRRAQVARRSTIEVLPLPVDGRPAGFESANVGHYELSSSVDRTRGQGGRGGHLEGDGARRRQHAQRAAAQARQARRLPRLRADDEGDHRARRRDPRRRRSTRTCLLPQKGGALSVPAIELAYFDPTTAKYAVAEVAADRADGRGRSDQGRVGVAGAPTQENVLGAADPADSQPRDGALERRRSAVPRARSAIIMLAVPPGAWLLVLIGDALRRRLGARDRAAPSGGARGASARRRLRVAEYHIKAQRPSAFFGECARVHLRAPRVSARRQGRGAHARRAARAPDRARLRSRDRRGDGQGARELRLRALRAVGVGAGRDARGAAARAHAAAARSRGSGRSSASRRRRASAASAARSSSAASLLALFCAHERARRRHRDRRVEGRDLPPRQRRLLPRPLPGGDRRLRAGGRARRASRPISSTTSATPT